MRQVKYLIQEAKQNTNTTDIEAISDSLCVRLLNRAQEFIQAHLFTANIEAKIFRGQASFTTISNVDTYQLPFNIYAKNSINNVFYKSGNAYQDIKQISEKSRGLFSGYFCSDNKIILSPMPTSSVSMFLSYTKKIPSIGISYGKILTVNLNLSIVIDSASPLLTGVDDYFSIVDSNGVIIKYAVPISQTGTTILISDTTNVLAGMYVIPGKYSTTHSELPDELESCLIMSLETMINARMSSKDIPISKSFGDEMLGQMISMFSENQTDTFTPPILEYSEWV